jgi:hypothetical protein
MEHIKFVVDRLHWQYYHTIKDGQSPSESPVRQFNALPVYFCIDKDNLTTKPSMDYESINKYCKLHGRVQMITNKTRFHVKYY